MASVDFAELKQRHRIEDVLPILGIAFRKEGDKLRGHCPACVKDARSRPSLVITPAKDLFYCHEARQGGDLISLVAHVRRLKAKDAAIVIAQHFGTVPVRGGGNGTVRTEPRSGSGQPADRSGQPDNQAQLERIAAYLDPDHASILDLDLTADFAREWGIGYAPRGTLVGRVAIPLHDRQGQLVGFCGVSLKDADPQPFKYPSNLDLTAYIFGAHRLAAGSAVIAANPLQAAQLAHLADQQAVCFLTETVGPLQFEMLASLLDEKGCEVTL